MTYSAETSLENQDECVLDECVQQASAAHTVLNGPEINLNLNSERCTNV